MRFAFLQLIQQRETLYGAKTGELLHRVSLTAPYSVSRTEKHDVSRSCERQGASRRFDAEKPAASALPLIENGAFVWQTAI